jgi:hypothetical protein
MSYNDVKLKIVNKILSKYKKKKIERNILRNFIISDVSQILNQAMKENEIKSYERINTFIDCDNGNIKIVGTIWPFLGAMITLNVDVNIK